VRVKSDSGKKLSDQEILQQIKVGQKDKKSLLLSFLLKNAAEILCLFGDFPFLIYCLGVVWIFVIITRIFLRNRV
jgi:hypothetical protein